MVDMSQPQETGSPESEAPKYPYGLLLNLDGGAMKKLGLDKALPSIGQTMTLTATAKVTALRQEEGQDETCYTSSLQITAMELAPAKEPVDPKAMYPNSLMS